MLSKARNTSRSKSLLFLSGLCITAASAGQTVAAHDYAQQVYDPVSVEFRASHPFRVFVDVAGRQDSRGRGIDPTDHLIRDKLHHQLPGNIVLVSDRGNADMIVRARLTDYDLAFHVTDVARRNKKYKKRRRHTPGKCGLHKRATYTRVTERGVSHADYQLTFKLRGDQSYRDVVQIQAAESYRYGKDLNALTNCGYAPSVHYPNKTVERLFAQAGGHFRDVLAREIEAESLQKLTHVLAGNIQARADQFYVRLASLKQAHQPHINSGARVYDYDDVNREPARRRLSFNWEDE